MKIKFNQSVATAETTYQNGEVYDVKDTQAKDFVEIGYAEKVETVEKKPYTKTVEKTDDKVEEKPKTTRARKPKASDDK